MCELSGRGKCVNGVGGADRLTEWEGQMCKRSGRGR